MHKHKFKEKHYIILQIISGPAYKFVFSGLAKRPGMTLSRKRYDFGPQFVLKQPLSKTFLLKVTNNDDSAMSIDCLWQKTDYLNVTLPPG